MKFICKGKSFNAPVLHSISINTQNFQLSQKNIYLLINIDFITLNVDSPHIYYTVFRHFWNLEAPL